MKLYELFEPMSVVKWYFIRLQFAFFYGTLQDPRKTLLQQSSTVLLVGTPNTFTIDRIRNHALRGVHLIVVEAEPTNADTLQRYVRRMSYKDVEVINKGAWHEKGTKKLLISERKGDHRLEDDSVVIDNDMRQVSDYGQYRERVIEVDTVDNILEAKGIDRLGFVEIATNGSELDILHGMTRTIDRTAGLYVQGFAIEANSGVPLNKKISQFLERHGFQVLIGRNMKSVSDQWEKRSGNVLAWRKT